LIKFNVIAKIKKKLIVIVQLLHHHHCQSSLFNTELRRYNVHVQ